MTSFVVEGVPIAQPRHRAAAFAGHARVYLPTSHPVHVWKAQVRAAYAAAGGKTLEGPVWLTAALYFPPRKGKPFRETDAEGKPFTGKPDCENVVKALMDSLSGLAYLDDKQVSRLDVWKLCSAQPRAEIRVDAL